MNRAERYSGMTLTFAVVLSLIAGIFIEQAVIRSNRKPEIVRTVIQSPSPNHVAASMGTVDQGSYDHVRHARDRAEAAFLDACREMYRRDPVHLRALPPACNYFATSMLAIGAPSNREGHPTAATPHPYSLHPDKTPLIDPTQDSWPMIRRSQQDAYYRSLLRDGRFPTTGSDPGRPR